MFSILFRSFNDSQVIASAIGALLGALSAFLLVVMRDWVGKIYDRKVKHYDALVRLELQLMDQGGVLNDNLQVLPKFISTLEKGGVYQSNLSEIEYDRNIIYDLHNLELISSLYGYYDGLRRTNDDIRSNQDSTRISQKPILQVILIKLSILRMPKR